MISKTELQGKYERSVVRHAASFAFVRPVFVRSIIDDNSKTVQDTILVSIIH